MKAARARLPRAVQCRVRRNQVRHGENSRDPAATRHDDLMRMHRWILESSPKKPLSREPEYGQRPTSCSKVAAARAMPMRDDEANACRENWKRTAWEKTRMVQRNELGSSRQTLPRRRGAWTMAMILAARHSRHDSMTRASQRAPSRLRSSPHNETDYLVRGRLNIEEKRGKMSSLILVWSW